VIARKTLSRDASYGRRTLILAIGEPHHLETHRGPWRGAGRAYLLSEFGLARAVPLGALSDPDRGMESTVYRGRPADEHSREEIGASSNRIMRRRRQRERRDDSPGSWTGGAARGTPVVFALFAEVSRTPPRAKRRNSDSLMKAVRFPGVRF